MHLPRSTPRFTSIRVLALVAAALASGCHDIHLDYGRADGEIVVFDDLYSVSVVDRQHAVAVGYRGAAYYTADGGASWKQGDTDGIRSSLYNVAMADPRNGWAVGQRGLVMRTTDGGKTWTRQPNLKENEGTHLFAVTAIDKDRAWAIGEWGTRIKTIDGGETWVDNSFTVDERHPMFQWLSPVEQEKVREGETVYEDVGINDVFCLGAPSRKCWLIGEFGYIFYSDDLGETWIRSTFQGIQGMPPVELGFNRVELDPEQVEAVTGFGDSILSEGHLNVAIEGLVSPREIEEFVVDGDPEPLFEILEARTQEVRTALEDAGLPFERVRMRGQPPWDYADYLDQDPEFLTRYLDSRRHETGGVKVRVIQNPILFTVRFRDEQNGLISGLGGVILRSEDGGKSWAYRKIDRTQAVFSVDAIEGRALAVGEKGLVRVSTDDGSTWSPPAEGTFPSIFTYLRDVRFEPTGEIGFIVGQAGQVLRSSDAGYKWVQVLPPVGRDGLASMF